MDLITVILIAAVLFCFIFAFCSRNRRPSPKNPPPTSPGLPLIGQALNIVPKSYQTSVDALAFGDVYVFDMGLASFTRLNSYRAIHEAFVVQAEVFAGRQKGDLVDALFHNAGVINTDGHLWQEHRRLLLRLLREFGLGKPLLADLVKEEISLLTDWLSQHQGIAVNSQDVFSSMTNNIISRLIFGERSGSEDKEFKSFTEHLAKTGEFKTVNALLFIFPKISKFAFLRNAFDYFSGIFYHMDKAVGYIRQKYEHHERLFRSLQPPPTEVEQATNICEALLIEQAIQERDNPGGHTFSSTQLIHNMFDLFAAGTDTTATTLNWGMLLLSIHPDVQERVQREIEEKIGRQRPPSTSDRQELPYVCATMDEILRYSSLVPFNLIHRTTRDTVLLGYDIPADTLIQCNLYGVHHDPKTWERPQDFYPGHFLSANGDYCPSKYLISFSLGKRACLGESMARMEYFLAFVALMQQFKVRLADGHDPIEKIIEGKISLVRRPSPHQVVFERLQLS